MSRAGRASCPFMGGGHGRENLLRIYTNLYHNMNRGFLEFLCNSITWNLELSSYHVDFRLWRLQAYVDNVHTC